MKKTAFILAGIVLVIFILLYVFQGKQKVVVPEVEIEKVAVEPTRFCAINEPINGCVCKGKVENNICKDRK